MEITVKAKRLQKVAKFRFSMSADTQTACDMPNSSTE